MASNREPVRVLFVCLGNICRSPQAEGAFRRIVQLAGLADQVQCDSAGTGGWHAGELPDRRTRATSARRGLPLDHHAQQVQSRHLDAFDLIVAMDASNLRHLQQMATPEQLGKLHLLRAFEGLAAAVAAGLASGCGERSCAPDATSGRLLRALPSVSGSGSGSGAADVPDPYYGGPEGFDTVFDICWRGSFGLLTHLCSEHGWPAPPAWLAEPAH